MEKGDTTWRRTVEKEWNIAGWTNKNMAKEYDRQHGGLRNYDTERHDEDGDIQ